MAHWHMLAFNLKKGPKIDELKAIFEANGFYWLRINVQTWIVFSNRSGKEWYELVQSQMTPEDSVVIMPVDSNDLAGFAPKWVWEKLRKPK